MSTEKQSFIDGLLQFISDAGYIFPGFESPYEHIRRLRRSTYYGTLRRLESKKVIVRKKVGSKYGYMLTAKGKRLMKERVRIKKRSDGFTTIVVFDIPEEKRKARNAFRYYLRKNGFRSLQKSVYISSNKIPATLIELVHELDLNANVSVIGGRVELYI